MVTTPVVLTQAPGLSLERGGVTPPPGSCVLCRISVIYQTAPQRGAFPPGRNPGSDRPGERGLRAASFDRPPFTRRLTAK